jgi:lysophospholipase L1-like esterase
MNWINNNIKVIITYLILFYLSLVVSDFLLKLLEKDYSGIERYKLSLKDENMYPVYSAWELWQTKKGPYVEINGQRLFVLTTLSNVSTIYCNEGYGWIKYKSDAYGFRNSRGYNNLNEKVNWLIGDSFVHGACVEENQTIQGNLEQVHNRSISLGIGGNGIGMGLGILKEIAEVKEDDNVLFFYYEGNDIPQIRAEITDQSTLTNYLEVSFKTGLYSVAQKKIDERILNEIEKNYKKIDDNLMQNRYHFLNHFYLKKISDTISNMSKSKNRSCEWLETSYNDDEFNNFFSVINSAKNYSESLKANFYLVYLPSYQSIFSNCEFAYERIINELKLEDVKIVDIRKTFTNSKKQSRYFSYGKNGGHYSPLGYQLVSNSILSELEKLNSNYINP